MTMLKSANSWDLMTNWLESAKSANKQAALDKAAADKLAGGGSDPHTTHPIGSFDNHILPMTEGARSAENNADASRLLGPAGAHGQEDAPSFMSERPGAMSSPAYKPLGVDDKAPLTLRSQPTTSYPSSVSDDKYAHLLAAADKLAAQMGTGSKTAASAPSATAGATSPAAPAAGTAAVAVASPDNSGVPVIDAVKAAAIQAHPAEAEAGYWFARQVVTGILQRQDGEKRAAEDIAAKMAASVRRSARADADAFCDYMDAWESKQADALEGGMPMAAPPAPGSGMEGMGGMGGEGGPGGPGGGGPQDEQAALEYILSLMEDEGISPEELEAFLTQHAGGGGGSGMEGMGGPGGGGGEEPAPEPKKKGPPEESPKEAAVKWAALNKQGRYQVRKMMVASAMKRKRVA